MVERLCPLCGSTECTIEELPAGSDAERINCQTIGTDFYLDTKISNNPDQKIRLRLLNLITEKLTLWKIYQTPTDKKLWYFVFSEADNFEKTNAPHVINLADELKTYPERIAQRVSRVLLNLGTQYPDVGKFISIKTHSYLVQRKMFCESLHPDNEILSILKYLKDLDYVDNLQGTGFVISFRGWQHIEELRSRFHLVNQGFIAMSYSDEARYIMEAFREAILSSGFKPQIIGEKEHNNQIIPEMFYEIERSKFMVVDVTYQNFGAYYEAGYAQALGKEVIVCCSEEVFNDPKSKPHFDISQKPIVKWKDADELKEKLKRRIEATVH